MHDWWLLLTAAAFGVVDFIDVPLALYRRHDGNALGVRGGGVSAGVSRLADARRIKEGFVRSSAQADAFLRRYGDRLDAASANAVKAFAMLPRLGWINRRMSIVRNGFWKSSPLRNLGVLLLV